MVTLLQSPNGDGPRGRFPSFGQNSPSPAPREARAAAPRGLGIVPVARPIHLGAPPPVRRALRVGLGLCLLAGLGTGLLASVALAALVMALGNL
jgi:hypothetical protein